jgi:hypothetical protein
MYGLLTLAQAELPVELINTPAGINQFLLACIKRVALGANLDSYVFSRATRLNNLTARALNGRLLVIRVYAFFHRQLSPLLQRTDGILTQASTKCKSFCFGADVLIGLI